MIWTNIQSNDVMWHPSSILRFKPRPKFSNALLQNAQCVNFARLTFDSLPVIKISPEIAAPPVDVVDHADAKFGNWVHFIDSINSVNATRSLSL